MVGWRGTSTAPLLLCWSLLLQLMSPLGSYLILEQDPAVDKSTIFWDDASEASMLQKADHAESQLRAYIYPIPGDAGRADLQQGVLSHFQLEASYYQFLQNENKSHHISLVTDPAQANAFFIDHHMLHLNSQHGAQGCQRVESHLRRIVEAVVDHQPFYNRSRGADHFFFAVYDHGPFCLLICDKDPVHGPAIFALMRRIEGANFIGNHGQDDLTPGDHQSHMLRTNSTGGSFWVTCHRVGQDIVVPQVMTFHSLQYRAKFPHTGGLFRPFDSSFAGSLWGDRDPTLRTMAKYRFVDYHVYKTERFHFDITGGSADIDMTPRSLLMWHTCGFACWSQRLFHAMAVSTVPLLVNSGTLQPFERFVDWRKISVKMLRETFVEEGRRRAYRAKLRRHVDAYRERLEAFLASTALNNEQGGTGPESWKGRPVPDAENLMSMYDNEYRLAKNASDAAFGALRDTALWRKKVLLEQASAWFDLSLKVAPQRGVSAYKLLSLEIWCRVGGAGAGAEPLCARAANFTGRLEYDE